MQWDPARDLMTSEDRGREPRRMLRERAIQIGLSRDLSARYVAGVLSIEDVSALSRQAGAAHCNKDERQVEGSDDGAAATPAGRAAVHAELPRRGACQTRAGQFPL